MVEMVQSYLVTPGVDPTLHALDRFKLLIMLLLPVFGKPASEQNQKHVSY